MLQLKRSGVTLIFRKNEKQHNYSHQLAKREKKNRLIYEE